ncbi:MAG: hypothetical protein R3C11_24305 [Planctomycetaceae bacterium]
MSRESIDQIGQKDQYTFTLTDRTILYFDTLIANETLKWSLTGPAGEIASPTQFSYFDDPGYDNKNIVLNQLKMNPGDYTLTVEGPTYGFQYATGSYSFTLYDLLDSNLSTVIIQGTQVDKLVALPLRIQLISTILMSLRVTDSILMPSLLPAQPTVSGVWLIPTVMWSSRSPETPDYGTSAAPIEFTTPGTYYLLVEGQAL